MNAFETGSKLETAAELDVIPFLESLYPCVSPIADLERQRLFGDYDVVDLDGNEWVFELKSESWHSGNLFIETWSNYTDGYENEGWLWKYPDSTQLLYYFLDTNDLYMVSIGDLRELVVNSYPDTFRTVIQRKHAQRNETHGLLLPIDYLKTHIASFQHVRL